MISLWIDLRLLFKREQIVRKMMDKSKLFSKLGYINRMASVLIIDLIAIVFRCKGSIMLMMVLNQCSVQIKIKRMRVN